jgi:hypothetical protein
VKTGKPPSGQRSLLRYGIKDLTILGRAFLVIWVGVVLLSVVGGFIAIFFEDGTSHSLITVVVYTREHVLFPFVLLNYFGFFSAVLLLIREPRLINHQIRWCSLCVIAAACWLLHSRFPAGVVSEEITRFLVVFAGCGVFTVMLMPAWYLEELLKRSAFLGEMLTFKGVVISVVFAWTGWMHGMSLFFSIGGLSACALALRFIVFTMVKGDRAAA